ncbi:RmlC-like cupin domain-containing protein [Mycena olivaceomarginata]|nr:RmlC-like cupin domain-containing protein [Mycena olivaceomarginata]
MPQASVTTPGPVPVITNGPEIASSLITAASEVDKLNKLLTVNGTLLTGPALRDLTVFDFSNTQNVTEGGKGGTLLLATVDNFPILEGTGISGAVAFIEPCGLNIPHMHPRASEILINIEGILDTGFVQENGFATEVETQLGLFQATVFPMGSIHYQQNPTCSRAMFVAGLSSDDPGRSDIATNFWMLPPLATSYSTGNDAEDSGDHNSISTRIFQLTDAGNSSVSDNLAGQYVVEGMAVQFNDTHFTQEASTTPWIAVFSCTESSKAGNASDLISNAERLDAHAIIPEYDKFYNASAMNKLAANITADFAALRADGSSLTQTDVVLARIPGIPMNVTAAAA